MYHFVNIHVILWGLLIWGKFGKLLIWGEFDSGLRERESKLVLAVVLEGMLSACGLEALVPLRRKRERGEGQKMRLGSPFLRGAVLSL